MEWLREINDHYANAIVALTPFIIGIVSLLYYGVYKESKSASAGAIYIAPSFWSLRKCHRIDTLKRYRLTDDKKNYEEIEILYTPVSWGEYISVKRNYFRTEIVPRNDTDILAVTIKRKPYENWKMIFFNK